MAVLRHMHAQITHANKQTSKQLAIGINAICDLEFNITVLILVTAAVVAAAVDAAVVAVVVVAVLLAVLLAVVAVAGGDGNSNSRLFG